MRRLRAALIPAERAAAARAVAQHVARNVRLARGAKVGAYLATRFELDTAPLLVLARKRGWRIFVPVIVSLRGARMRFVPLSADLRINRFGIAEPRARGITGIAPRWLDLVFVPLLAVGPNGERLGAGAGFYDRAFGHRRSRRAWRKPELVGIAFECQRIPQLTAASWDVALDGLITERGIYRFTEGK
jgi:5-formyltetrahydrofolate cyclo-ligase